MASHARALFFRLAVQPRAVEHVLVSPNGRHLNGHVTGLTHETRLALVGTNASQVPTDPTDTVLIDPDFTFRHYTTAGGLEQIVRHSLLIPGPKPFSFGTFPYVDLYGAFLTLPHFKPEAVGVIESARYFVDLCLPHGMTLLRLTDNEQYWMIPGEIKHHDSFISAYQKWLELGMPDKSRIDALASEWNYSSDIMSLYGLSEQFSKICASGGINEPSRIPIQVKAHGRLPT